MKIIRNYQLQSSHGRPFLLDLYYLPDGHPKPLLLFAHGFKGFKDWGHWELIGKSFAQAGFAFLKFNFSHNGTTIDQPLDFADLDAFGHNNFSRELADLDTVLNWLYTGPNAPPQEEIALKHLCLIGHSRGGAVSLLKTNLDDRITALITWASVSSLDYAWRDPSLLSQWKKNGVFHVQNSRTKQEMPLYYQLYEDYKANEDKLNVKTAAGQLRKPYLIIHGTDDPSVAADAARQLHQWAPASELHLIEGADHVFGGRHPYPDKELPPHSQELVTKCRDWLKNSFHGRKNGS